MVVKLNHRRAFGGFALAFAVAVGLFLAASTLFAAPASASVLGIDLSTEFMKIAAVRPGNPFHIVVDEQAKRKVPLAVAFDDGDRHFGNNAVGFAIRRPLHTFMWAHRLLGKTINSPQVESLKKVLPYEFVAIPGRGQSVGIKFPGADGPIYSPEELVAMSLEHVRRIAQVDAGGLDTRDCVITVPTWFSQNERQAVLDAAELADLSVLDLVNDPSSVAITYGIDRTYQLNTTHRVIFYDMGSAGTDVAIVEYTGVKLPRATKVSGQAEVLATAHDQFLGGFAFDQVVAEMIIDAFEKKYGDKAKGIRQNPRAMAKVLKQANAVKTVLSANSEMPFKIESLYNDIDFSLHLNRADFQEKAAGLLSRVTKPITEALERANLSIKDIDSLVIVGGSVRVPAVQALLRDFLGQEKLAQNVNGDEAMAMGAAFRAANLSTSFQVRPFGILDITAYPVDLKITDARDASAFAREVKLFKERNRIGRKKTVSILHDNDLLIELTQSNVAAGSSSRANAYEVKGVADLANDPTLKPLLEVQKPKISLSFVLGENGVTSLAQAEAVLEELPEPEPEPEPAAESNQTAEGANATDAAKTKPKPTKKVRRIPLTVVPVEPLTTEIGFVRLTKELKAQAKAVLAALNEKDAARKALAAAKNSLESLIYTMRNDLSEKEVEAVTNEAQREAIAEASAAAEMWLYSDGYTATLADVEAKLKQLRDLVAPVALRRSELQKRPAAIADAKALINKVQAKVSSWLDSRPWLTSEDTQPLKKLADELKAYIQEVSERQNATPAYETPAVLSSEIYEKFKPISNLIARLERKKAPSPPPPANNGTAANATNGNATTANDGEQQQQQQQEQQQEQSNHDNGKEAPKEGGNDSKDKDGKDEL